MRGLPVDLLLPMFCLAVQFFLYFARTALLVLIVFSVAIVAWADQAILVLALAVRTHQ